jgi:hypothetical protein
MRQFAIFHGDAAHKGHGAGNISIDTLCHSRDGPVGSRHQPIGSTLKDRNMFGDFGDLGQDLNRRAAWIAIS